MGEHDSVHELHPIMPARGQHLLQICHTRSAGLFADDMLAGMSSAHYTLLAYCGGERQVNRVHLIACQQLLVRSERIRNHLHRRLRLTFGDEPAAAFNIATSDGCYCGVTAKLDGLPVLSCDLSSAQNAPANV